MTTFGLFAGVITLLIIGLGFPLVIQAERVFGYLSWPYLLGTGILLIAASLFVPNEWLSLAIGVLGAACAWGSTELKEQAVRADIGWYPFRANKVRLPFSGVIEKWRAPHL
jgi:Domain of unknown function (DUF4491)